MSPEQIFEAALALSPEKREELVYALEQTLVPCEFDEQFHAELDRRWAEMEKNPESMRPFEEVIREARNRLK